MRQSLRFLPHKLPQLSLVFLLLCTVLLSACGGDASAQQQAQESKTKFEKSLQTAKDAGVPADLLDSLIQQQNDLNNTGSPFSPFNDQPVNDYNQNLSIRYAQLDVQVQGLLTLSTQQLQMQAQSDLGELQNALSQRRSLGLPVDMISHIYDDAKNDYGKAKLPKDFISVSTKAKTGNQMAVMLLQVSQRLTTFKDSIEQMKSANINVTAMQNQFDSDQQALKDADSTASYDKLNILIDAQYQQAVVSSTQSIPYITEAKLTDFQKQIEKLKTYGVDASSYEQKLQADRDRLKQPMAASEYIAFSKQIDSEMSAMHTDLLKGETSYTVKQYHQKVSEWDNNNSYRSDYDDKNHYYLAGYETQGMGEEIDGMLANATTDESYQAILDLTNNLLFNLSMFQENFHDQTPFDQQHATDMKLLEHYKSQQGQTIVINFSEQALRVYNNGKLEHSFLVTTGQENLPSLPGYWSVLSKLSPTVFKSPFPKGSPYWFEDTPINYAVGYHDGGYFIHDAYWRSLFGPNTQFPHYDPAGGSTNNGSHGCVNLPTSDTAWIYNNTDWNTSIIIY